MTRLESVLTEAAEDAPVRFEVADIRQRAARRRHRRRVMGRSVVVMAVVAAIVVVTSTGGNDERLDAAGEPHEEFSLVGRWAPIADQELIGAAEGVYVEFRDDGWFTGFNGCNEFGGSWRLDDGQLRVSEIQVNANGCAPSVVIAPITDLLAEHPTVSRLDGRTNTLRLSSASGTTAFEWTGEATGPMKPQDASIVQATWSSATETEPGNLQLTVPCQYSADEVTDRLELHETDTSITVDIFVRVPNTAAAPCDGQSDQVDVSLIDPVGGRNITQTPRPSPEQP